jgi:hypothetical protein
MPEDQDPFDHSDGDAAARASAALRRIGAEVSERRELIQTYDRLPPDKRRLLLELVRAMAEGDPE